MTRKFKCEYNDDITKHRIFFLDVEVIIDVRVKNDANNERKRKVVQNIDDDFDSQTV